jgi:hypothetical protein
MADLAAFTAAVEAGTIRHEPQWLRAWYGIAARMVRS